MEIEVDRQLEPQLVQAADQALRVVGIVRRRPVAFRDQWTRQVHLRAVDGEDPVPSPQFAGLSSIRPAASGNLLEDPGMKNLENVLVQLGPGVAHGRCRHRRRLRQFDPQRPALVPKLGKGDRIALPALREHQPEDEQHDQKRVQHPPALLPGPVVAVGDGDRRSDDAAPEPHERIVRGEGRRRPAPALDRPWSVQQCGPAVPRQGEDVDTLLRLAFPMRARLAPLRHADLLPVGRAVAGRIELRHIDEGLRQQRPEAVERIPVVGKLPQGRRQRLRSKEFYLDPGENDEP